jgi:lipid-binding SYLF domain-containing protein
MEECDMRNHSSYALMGSLLLAGAVLGAPAAHATNHDQAAQRRVNAAIKVVDEMRENPGLTRLLERASGVFIVPRYGRGGFIVGGQSGGGVVLERHEDRWSYPAFFDIGGGSIGAQAGGEGGAVAMILMTPRAMHKFEHTRNTWALNASAGLTVVNWSDRAQADSGNGDVVLWSDSQGLYAGLTASITDIRPDRKLDHAYYGRTANAREILSDQVKNPEANPLRHALRPV